VSAFARVAPPLPVAGTFSYAIPPELAGRVVPGTRVQVPFGGRRLAAVVVGLDDAPPPGVSPKPLLRLLDDEPVASRDILELGAWVAGVTGCSWGEALDATLPPAVKTGRATRSIEEIVLVSDPRLARPQVEALQGRHEKQARALRILAERGGVAPVRELMDQAHVSRSPLASLVAAGLCTLRHVPASHDPLLGRDVARTLPLALTPDQRAARDALVAGMARAFESGPGGPGAGRGFLLFGVTGSGKTEVYLQTLAECVARGRQGLVLVPEISLTPQTVRRFRERFERVAVLHSHLTDAERAHQWRRIRRGEADVVVGARSAVFAPVPSLGLVILDEEHETTFKQQNVPRYHAREAALERTRLCGAITVLGTATPSLEAWHAAQDGRLEVLRLHERLGGGRSPEIVVVDLKVEQRRGGRFSFLTDPLRAAMEDALARDGQVLLFLNRRGWSPVMLCGRCRQSLRCPHCSVSMTVHRRANRVICHYCGTERAPPAQCPQCAGPLHPLGYGTEKVEEEVRQGFLHASVARMDSDTMSGRGSHEQALADFAAGRTSVLIGTQMIAKGLDFPNVLLVGVICADSALFLPDYRAAERTFQLLAQVVGRTGRGPRGGRVVVQAFDPRHVAIRTGVAQDYEAFVAHELPLRREAGYPPFARLVRVVLHAPDEASARARAAALAGHLRAPPVEDVDVLGPAPAPIGRIAGQYRWHLVLKCAHDAAVGAALARLAGQVAPKGKVRVLVDVDPVGML